MTVSTSPPATSPKLFVSYSWTSAEHEAWVLRLATDLRESGIDVIFDKWDLKEGNDAHAFMEKMVTDREIKKVILICDKMYVDKTDGRSGGVGTEAQIISGEIYEKQDQDKFVAVIKECDEKGKPYRPAYYRSRIYIDLSDVGTYSENFDRLLRWVFNRPLFKKPEIGSKPAFLHKEDNASSLATSSRQRRAVDAIKNSRDHAIPATSDYFTYLSGELEKYRIDPGANPFDGAVAESIESFLPYRNEAIEVFTNLAIYLDTIESRTAIHRFFEQLIPYLDVPANVNTYRDTDWDNFRFIVHELFLYAVVISIVHNRFDAAAHLMANRYYVPTRVRFGLDVMSSFVAFSTHMQSLDVRNHRLQSRRLSLRGDLLKDRCKGTGVDFRNLMQADFVLFIRSLAVESQVEGIWFPETLVHANDQVGAFELFARSRSKAYFDRAKILLGIDNVNALVSVTAVLQNNPNIVPRWQYNSVPSFALLGLDRLATEL
jgi:hypothetical protein